jgi:hypothetical protein
MPTKTDAAMRSRRAYEHGEPIVGTEYRKLEWGLPAPLSAPAAWGARAIGSGQGFDLLWDRQCAWGEKEDRDRIGRLLNGHVLKAAMQEWRDLRDLGEVASDVHKEVVLYEDDEIVMKGNSNASGSPKYGDPGYVYLVAYLKNTDTDTDTDGENR